MDRVLHRMKGLENYAIGAIDGTIGHVKDFYVELFGIDESYVLCPEGLQGNRWWNLDGS